MPFFRRLTGHRVTMRGCSIISVATVSRLQNSMRLSLKVISGLSAVRSGVGLPSRIVFKNGDDISHVYSADGSKLRTVRVADGDTLTTDYCGNMIYENGVPVRLMTDVGKVEWSGSSVRRLLFREPLWILWK